MLVPLDYSLDCHEIDLIKTICLSYVFRVLVVATLGEKHGPQYEQSWRSNHRLRTVNSHYMSLVQQIFESEYCTEQT